MSEDCLYFITDESGFCKIGHSTDPIGRLKTLQTGNPSSLKMLACYIIEAQHGGAKEVEAQLHRILQPVRVRGEWFLAGTDTLDFACRAAIHISAELTLRRDKEPPEEAEKAQT